MPYVAVSQFDGYAIGQAIDVSGWSDDSVARLIRSGKISFSTYSNKYTSETIRVVSTVVEPGGPQSYWLSAGSFYKLLFYTPGLTGTISVLPGAIFGGISTVISFGLNEDVYPVMVDDSSYINESTYSDGDEHLRYSENKFSPLPVVQGETIMLMVTDYASLPAGTEEAIMDIEPLVRSIFTADSNAVIVEDDPDSGNVIPKKSGLLEAPTSESEAVELGLHKISYKTEDNSFSLLSTVNGTNTDSFAAGGGYLSDALYSTSIGYASGVTNALLATAIGYAANATGTYSIAIGGTASGERAVSLGTGSNARGATSLAFGTSSEADGDNSIALGNYSVSSGVNSLALSGGTAIADNSVAIGSRTKTNFAGSMAHSAGNSGSPNALNQYERAVIKNAGPFALLINGSDNLDMPLNATVAFDTIITSKNAAGTTKVFQIKGAVYRGLTGEPRFVGTPTKTVIAEDAGASAWDIATSVSAANGLRFTASGSMNNNTGVVNMVIAGTD